jgi:chlorite dismutase
MATIKRKMEQMAKELAQNEEIGLDESTLMRIFEAKTDKMMSANRFTFEDQRNINMSLNESNAQFHQRLSR